MIFTPAARVATSSNPSVSTTIGAQPYTPLALIAIIMHNISRYTCLDKQYDNGCFDASYHGRAIGGIAGGAAGPTHEAHGCVWLRATQGGLRACMHACMRGVEHTIATCILCREYQLKTFHIQHQSTTTSVPTMYGPLLVAPVLLTYLAPYAQTLRLSLLRLTDKIDGGDGRVHLERLRQRLRPLVPDLVPCRGCARAGQA